MKTAAEKLLDLCADEDFGGHGTRETLARALRVFVEEVRAYSWDNDLCPGELGEKTIEAAWAATKIE